MAPIKSLRAKAKEASSKRSFTKQGGSNDGGSGRGRKKVVRKPRSEKEMIDTTFKFKPLNARIKDISVDVSSLLDRRKNAGLDLWQDDLGEDEESSRSLFAASLARQSQLNLSLPFTAFLRAVTPLSRSLPLVLYHRETIVDEIINALHQGGNEEYRVLVATGVLDVIPAFALDLTLTSPYFLSLLPKLLQSILSLAMSQTCRNHPEILEKAFQVAAWTFKGSAEKLASDFAVVDGSKGDVGEVWSIVRLKLGQGVEEMVSVEGQEEEDMDDAKDSDAGEDDEDEDGVVDAEGTEPEPNAGDGGDEVMQLDDPVDDQAGEDLDDVDGESAQEELEEENVETLGDAEKDVADEEADPMASTSDVPKPSTKIKRRPPAHPEFRRLLSEAFSFVVRKAKAGPELDGMSRVFVEEISREDQIVAESIVNIMVESMKSVDHRVHSRSPTILHSFIQAILESASRHPDTEKQWQALRAVLIALIHHSRAEYFDSVTETVIQVVREELGSHKARHANLGKGKSKAGDIGTGIRLRVAVKLLTALVGTRKGARITDAQRPTIFATLADISEVICAPDMFSVDQDLLDEFTTLTVSMLSIGRLEDVLSKGKRVIDAFFRVHPQHAYAMTGALSNLTWPLFNDFILPNVTRTTLPFLLPESTSEIMQERATSLLATLARDGRLQALPSGDTFMLKVLPIVESRLEQVVRLSGSALSRNVQFYDFLDILTSSRSLRDTTRSTFTSLFHTLVQGASTEATRENFAESPYNRAHALASLLQSANQLVHDQMRSQDGQDFINETLTCDEGKAFEHAIIGFAWHRGVLKALAGVAGLSSPNLPMPFGSFDKVYDSLKDAILSEDSLLRLSSLRLMAAFLRNAPSSDSQAARGIVDKAIAAEEVPLTFQTARERTMKLRQVGNAALPLDEDLALDIAVRYLLANLKIGFRPLWSDAIQCLTEISKKRPELVWSTAFPQLAKSALQDLAALSGVERPSWSTSDHTAADSSQSNYSNTSFHCHNLSNLEIICRTATDQYTREDSAPQSQRGVIEVQFSSDRLNVDTYEAQLLELMMHMSNLAQKHSRHVVELFFTNVHVPSEDEESAPAGRPRPPRERMVRWLGLFSKFSNPKALYRSTDLYTLFTNLLSSGDASVQKAALDCILLWKLPGVGGNEEGLRGLLDDKDLRGQLLKLSLEPTTNITIDPVGRASLLEVTIRLLYGLLISRHGRRSSAKGQAARRTTILGALRNSKSASLNVLIDLMIKPFSDITGCSRVDQDANFAFSPNPPVASTRRQMGFLLLLEDVLKYLGRHISVRWPDLLVVLMNLIHFADRQLRNEGSAQSATVIEENGQGFQGSASLKRIRQLGIRRLTEFFRQMPTYPFQPYIAAAFPSFISPRLPRFAMENSQSPSALLGLFLTWATEIETVDLLVRYDNDVLPAIFACLSMPNAKSSVTIRILDMVQKLLDFADRREYSGKISGTIIRPHVDALLRSFAFVLERKVEASASKYDLAKQQTRILARLAPYISPGDAAVRLLGLIGRLLKEPAKVVPEHVKTDLLRVASTLLPLIGVPSPVAPASTNDARAAVIDLMQEALPSLFATLRFRQSRQELAAAFNALARTVPDLQRVAEFLVSLNAFSTKRVEEPDFDRRLQAFAALNEQAYSSMEPRDWRPLTHSMLFFLEDPEELSIRSNAAQSLRRLLEQSTGTSRLDEILAKVLVPGLLAGLRSKIEVVRTEFLNLISFAVEKRPDVGMLKEMQCLLVEGDLEANFFLNINHIQLHRRTRALRRLSDEASQGSFSDKLISDVFLPLAGHFVAEAGTSKDQELANEAIQSIGRLAGQLRWSTYNQLLQRYLRPRKAAVDEATRKLSVRVVVSVLKHFHFKLDQAEDDKEVDHAIKKISASVNDRLLPRLLTKLQGRDEADEALRIPFAEGICTVVLHLSPEKRDGMVARLIMSLAHILRSRSQDVRDLVRSTLCNIAVSLGPLYFPVVVRELKGALARGPQLHVLAFTLHALLLRLVAENKTDSFSTAVEEMVPILSEDVFGQANRDRESQEFRAKTKFREVRSFKSMDSFKMVATYVPPKKFSKILAPVRDVLRRSESAKTMKDVDDVLKHVAQGLVANQNIDAESLLGLCYALISQEAEFLRQKAKGKGGRASKDYRVQLSRNIDDAVDHFAKNVHRLIAFGFDVFNAAYKKNRFDLADEQILAHMDRLVNLAGNALYSDDSLVVSRALRTTASLIRSPLPTVGKAAPVFLRQMLAITRQSPSLASELAQSALKTLAGLIRECKTAELTEKELTELLDLISPELEETDRQAVLFALLRSIVSRRLVCPEIYDIMDRVAEMLVTNQSQQVREVCRAIYLQFLLDYPQGKGRLKKTMAFFAKNLSYVHDSGRLSVLELLSAILQKFSVTILQESFELFFVSLTMTIANDDSSKCREIAAELVKLIFSRVESETRTKFMAMLRAWATQDGQPHIKRTALQLLGTILDASSEFGKAEAVPLVKLTVVILGQSASQLQEAETVGDDSMEGDLDWRLAYHSLQSLLKVFKSDAGLMRSLGTPEFWASVREHLLFPHAWVRTSATRLIAMQYSLQPADAEIANESATSTDSLIDAATKFSLQLKSKLLDDQLALQIVKNLFFIGKAFAQRFIPSTDASEVDGSDDEEEDENEGGKSGDDGENSGHSDLRWLIVKLSKQVRAAHIAKPSVYEQNPGNWSRQPASILRFFAAMINHLDEKALKAVFYPMMSSLYRLIEDPNTKDPQMVELQTLATEVQTLLQSKIGTTLFSTTYNQIRQSAVDKRNARKNERALQAVSDPAVEARLKAKKNEAKARNKKRKNRSFADGKLRYGVGAGAIGASKRARREE